MRPARTTPGGSITAGAALLVGGRDEMFCYEECEKRDVKNVSPIAAETGYGAMLNEHAGFSGGLALAGPALSKHPGMLGLISAFGQLSLQNDRVAVAAGVDAAANMVGGSLAADLTLAPGLALTAGVRHHNALHEPDGDIDRVEVDSAEASATLRWRLLVLQYSYTIRESGRLELPQLIEGATQARSWHAFLVGIRLDRATAPHSNL
jgi:hypothetical protein